MSSEQDSELLSAYLDGEVNSAELNRVNTLLRNSFWQDELSRLERSKEITGMAPQVAAPVDLVEELKRKYARPSPKPRILSFPPAWTTIGSLAAAALLIAVWFTNRSAGAATLPLESLLAAHARYHSESAVHLGPVVAARYSAFAQDARYAIN